MSKDGVVLDKMDVELNNNEGFHKNSNAIIRNVDVFDCSFGFSFQIRNSNKLVDLNW